MSIIILSNVSFISTYTQSQSFPAVLRVVPVDPLAVEWRLTDDLVRQESVHILDATKKRALFIIEIHLGQINYHLRSTWTTSPFGKEWTDQ